MKIQGAIVASVATLFAGTTSAEPGRLSPPADGQVYVAESPDSPGYMYVSSVISYVDVNGFLFISASITNGTDQDGEATNLICSAETRAGRVWVGPSPDEEDTMDMYFRKNESRFVSFTVRAPGATGRVTDCAFQE